jgi:hypothetical protein
LHSHVLIVAAIKIHKVETHRIRFDVGGNRIRFTVGGDRIDYKCKVSTPTAN